jgi:hypothetical protein
MFTRKGWRILLAFSLLALLAALSMGMGTPRTSAESWSFVRIFHASPGAGIVDVFMDGTKILSNFQYGTLTGYTPVVAGAHKVQIAAIGTGVNAAVLTQDLSLQAGMAYTVVALGSRTVGLSLHVFADDNRIAGNRARVRIYNLSPEAGVVNISTGGQRLIAGLSYAQASNYIGIPPGAYTFDVMATQGGKGSSVSARLKPWTVTSIFVISPLKSHTANDAFQFVQAQIAGIPGMPDTGSDPRTSPVGAPAPSPFSGAWPLAWLMFELFLAGILTMILSRCMSGKVLAERSEKESDNL